MKNLFKRFGIIVLAVIIGLAFAACGNPSGGGGGGGGGKELPGTITLFKFDADQNVVYGDFLTGDTIYVGYDEVYDYSSEWKLNGEVIRTGTNSCNVEKPGLLTVTISAEGYNSKTSDPVTISVSITPAEYFTFDAATGTITDYSSAGPKDINIPTSIDGIQVTAIGDNAFYSDELTSVIIPNSVITIDHQAFYYNQLTTVTIPNSVTTIGTYAFSENYLMTSVTIGDSVTSIGEYAFNKNNLSSVTIPDSVVTIEDDAFNANHLTSVTIGANVQFDLHVFEMTYLPEFYTSNGKQAGTYTYQAGGAGWSFTPRE